MKRICYVMLNPAGPQITTISGVCQQDESDEANLELFAPDKLRGYLREAVNDLLGRGWVIANWHVTVDRSADRECHKRTWLPSRPLTVATPEQEEAA